jgi:Flp pilus assembly protein TadG
MKTFKRQEGQTLIETAFVLFLLLLIVLGITEFSRAWYTKNTLKNAARTGVRVAVVTSGIANGSQTKPTTVPTGCGALLGNEKVFCYIWNTTGIPADSTATIAITEDVPPSGASPSDTIQITVATATSGPNRFSFVVGGSPWPWPKNINLSADASMRYE